MALQAQIVGRTLPITDLRMTNRQNRVPEFRVTIPAALVAGEDLFLESIAILDNGVQVESGIVSALPQSVARDGDIGFIQLKCDNELGRLAIEAGSTLHFQHTTMSSAIATLLATAQLSTWAVGDTTTLTNDEITVDPRSKENLWSQIMELVKRAGTPTYVRYGGLSGSTHQLDIGSFAAETDTYLVEGRNLIDPPRYKQSSREPIKVIYPISGKSSTRPVNLQDALLTEPGLSSDPDYPLTTDRIINNTITNGVYIRKTIQAIKAKNDAAATPQAKSEVAVSLYRNAVRIMRESNPYFTLSVECVLPETPQINDMAWVDSIAVEPVYDIYTERTTFVEVRRIQQWLRIVGIDSNFDEPMAETDHMSDMSREGVVYRLQLTSANDDDIYDAAELMTDAFTNYHANDDGAIGTILGQEEVSVTHNGVASDCTGGWGNGKLFDFTMPTVPAGATDVTVLVTGLDPLSVDYAVNRNAALPGTSFRLCVSGPSGNPWTVSDDVTVTVNYIFT